MRKLSALLTSTLLLTSTAAPISRAEDQPAIPGMLHNIKVLPDKAPDNTSLKSIIQTITRDCKTNDEKAIAIYNYCMLTNYHFAYPTEPGGIPVLKEINTYGWSLCGGLHTVQSALWIEAGWEHRYVGWNGHTTVEAKYDGRWHYLDVFLKFYAWEPDGKGGRTIASEDDLTRNSQELIKNAFVLDKARGCVYAKDNQFLMNGEKANWRAPAFLSCGDTIADVISGLKTHHAGNAEPGWAGINHATGNYSTDVALAPGLSLTNNWDPSKDDWFWAGQKKAPAHTCSGHKDTRNDPAYGLILEPYIKSEPARSYANGTIQFAPDFANDAFLKSFHATENVKFADKSLQPAEAGKPASVVLKLTSPYVISGKSSGLAEGADKIELSLDGGKSYITTDFEKLGAAAKGKLEAIIRVTFSKSLKSFNLSVDVQNNPGALPYLSPGKNVVTVSADNAQSLGDNKLVVTYAYRLGSRTKSFDQLCDEGKEVADQDNAKWSNTITFSQKILSKSDLPANFEIDCPTPKGQYPVYPRMLFVRREVISATSSPLPLPTSAVEAKPANADELQTLPNPFLIGGETPVAVKARATKTVQIPLNYIQYSDEKGAVAEKGLLAWPKNAGEKGKVLQAAVQLAGELSALPPAKNISEARLIVPVISGHNKASAKLGVAFLKSPAEKGKPCDFKDLADVAGTTIIPTQPADAPEYKPAKTFPIDITSAIKSIARGETKFNCLAVRIVPDRGIDDGWTVRCIISPTEPAYLEIETFADEPRAAKE